MIKGMIKEEAIRLPFNYAAGAIGSAYLAGLADERLLATRCDPCDRVLSPARSLCPFCGHQASEQLVEVGPSGVVESWTTMPDGMTFVLVRLDGADTAMLHRFVGTTREHPGSRQPTVGDRVRAVFDPTGLVGFEVTQP